MFKCGIARTNLTAHFKSSATANKGEIIQYYERLNSHKRKCDRKKKINFLINFYRRFDFVRFLIFLCDKLDAHDELDGWEVSENFLNLKKFEMGEF